MPVKKTSSILAVAAVLLLRLLDSLSGAETAEVAGPETLLADAIPVRTAKAVTGMEFARRTAGMFGDDLQRAALAELRSGNIPNFLRRLKPVTLSRANGGTDTLSAVVWVMPDYLAIGSDTDFLRIPLGFPAAAAIANRWDFVLPTPKIVDAIYVQASCHLDPDPLPPGPEMCSSQYTLKHRQLIREQRLQAGCTLGELTSGHKKDLVLTNLLLEKPGRVAIYGWHRQDGEPIQPLSTVHQAAYADYSHGVRLVSRNVWMEGRWRSLFDLLQDPVAAPLFTYEGELLKARQLMGLKR